MFVFCALKLLVNFIWDDTRLYKFYLVPLTGICIGISIFYLVFHLARVFYFLVKDSIWVKKVINYLDNISFEFYLVHYFFITFPINLVFDINPILNFILILVVSYFSSNVLHLISNETYKVIKLCKRKH